MKIVRTAKQAGLGYPLDRVKEYLRVTSTDQDGTIAALISAAIGVIEQETWIHCQTADYTLYLDDYKTFEIPQSPVTSITAVKYYDTTPTLHTMSRCS